jgi:HAD superfamily hydrolase (TIGR01549 family)
MISPLTTDRGLRHGHTVLALSSLELLDQLSPVLISEQEGVEKPDPSIFQRACNQAGVDPEDALHIGDAPVE